MLDEKLNSFDPAVRAAAFDKAVAGMTAFNLHCHSFFSYNGYGYSPSYLVALAREQNWRAVGLVDFDVLDGVDEFLGAAKKIREQSIFYPGNIDSLRNHTVVQTLFPKTEKIIYR